MLRSLLAVAFAFLLTFAGCSDSVGPTPPTAKDPRTYMWSLDTVFYEDTPGGFGQTWMRDFWGLNDSLVYMVGFESNYGYGAMWKFDGRTWTRVHLNAREGGTLNKVPDLCAIEGFAENDIYAFGLWPTNPKGYYEFYTLGLHYDGVQWREISMPPGRGIYSAFALSPTEIYCGGLYDGQLYHFNGGQWSVDTIASCAHPELELNVGVVGLNPTQGVYLQTEQWKTTYPPFHYQQMLRRSSHTSFMLDSAYNDAPWGGRSFWQSKEGHLYSCGTGGIYRLSGERWTPVYSTDYIYAVYGTSENHLFAVGTSSILFFDGRSWQSIAQYLGTNFEVHLWCSENQVFVSCSDGIKTYVFHGK